MAKTTQARFTLTIVAFFILLSLITILVIQQFVAPQLKRSESRLVKHEIAGRASAIVEQMNRVQAQVRSITQSIALMDSEDIDTLLPGLVDQYQDINVFGGGIWPLPNQREDGRDKYSTFFARGNNHELKKNTYWNLAESDNYYEQPWYEDGMASPAGQCAWANAYQDDASIEPRTNCAMAIRKQGQLYGVATIDVTLGFFNDLAKQMGEAIGGQVLIVEADGKIVGNAEQIGAKADLLNVSDLAGSLPMAQALSDLLPPAENHAAQESEYQANGESRTLFLQPIQDSPWYLAADLPTQRLTQQTDSILNRLGMVQIPMALIMLVVLLLFIRSLM